MEDLLKVHQLIYETVVEVAWACMAATRSGSLIFSIHIPADGSSKIISVYAHPSDCLKNWQRIILNTLLKQQRTYGDQLKQAWTKDDWNTCQAEHHQREHPATGDFYKSQTSKSHCLQTIYNKVLNMTIFIALYVYSQYLLYRPGTRLNFCFSFV